ncbi:uncharacterized protein LOC131164152 [Malania oleifera]|uniref:uncharacterized protein LOC131164152 n=1 Tax=Malania oleifera TaxID=397392 RepID=UPI0025ADD5A2|nr:uncharacterized protein LOC131164152 [Malania oleifera]
MAQNHQPVMEITIISARGLKKSSFSPYALFSRRLRPFLILTTGTVPPENSHKSSHVYKTRVDDGGGPNPTWGDKFNVPIEYSSPAFIYLQIFSKRLMAAPTQLGWCHIPAADVADGLHPDGAVRRLSYRLRASDGSRGHGVVNIAVRLVGQLPFPGQRPSGSDQTQFTAANQEGTVIGIPMIGSWRGAGSCL